MNMKVMWTENMNHKTETIMKAVDQYGQCMYKKEKVLKFRAKMKLMQIFLKNKTKN